MANKIGFFFTGDELLTVAGALRGLSIALEDDEDAQGYDVEQSRLLDAFAQKLLDIWNGNPKTVYEVTEHC
ncbi:hypothetical protein [Dyella sp. SG609]|uniref:hypothetical protein n=1 Tax=Dyella sp. SG609 TaxID=2587018 RepID=UPI001448039C|nr:hypothetical protein [Dyella sp. SG609]NKJ23283.1 hypothetical protein [Dyella sp. SG609]